MKLIKFFIAVILSILVVSVAACGNTTEPMRSKSTKYGVVYSHYVCAATVELENDAIKSVKFDEAEGPYSWARISNITTEINEADKVANLDYTGTGTNHAYAKKIKIGDVVFSARNNGNSNNYADYYNAEKNGETPFEMWLAFSDNAKWYYENIGAGNYDALNDDDMAYNITFKTVTTGELSKADRWLKSKNGYWPASETRKGWAANISAMEDYIKNQGFSDYEATRDALNIGEGEIEINEVKTGATLAYFKDYMNLALAANSEALNEYNNVQNKTTRFVR